MDSNDNLRSIAEQLTQRLRHAGYIATAQAIPASDDAPARIVVVEESYNLLKLNKGWWGLRAFLISHGYDWTPSPGNVSVRAYLRRN